MTIPKGRKTNPISMNRSKGGLKRGMPARTWTPRQWAREGRASRGVGERCSPLRGGNRETGKVPYATLTEQPRCSDWPLRGLRRGPWRAPCQEEAVRRRRAFWKGTTSSQRRVPTKEETRAQTLRRRCASLNRAASPSGVAQGRSRANVGDRAPRGDADVNLGPAADLVRVDESEAADLAHEDADNARPEAVEGVHVEAVRLQIQGLQGERGEGC
jgi:hypothetical protein